MLRRARPSEPPGPIEDQPPTGSRPSSNYGPFPRKFHALCPTWRSSPNPGTRVRFLDIPSLTPRHSPPDQTYPSSRGNTLKALKGQITKVQACKRRRDRAVTVKNMSTGAVATKARAKRKEGADRAPPQDADSGKRRPATYRSPMTCRRRSSRISSTMLVLDSVPNMAAFAAAATHQPCERFSGVLCKVARG
jgi:hypothetical protein